MQTPPAYAETGQQYADVPKREEQRREAAVGIAGKSGEDRAHGPVEQREVPVLTPPRPAGEADVLLKYGCDSGLKAHGFLSF